MHHPLAWILFHVFVVAMLVLDIKVFHRTAREVRIREALLLSLFWIVLALAFNVGIYFWLGRESALQFLAGYLIERALSIDNLFVFLLIFNYFQVPARYHHKILLWGILGALVMRGLFIVIGVTLINRFVVVLYLFGGLLIYTGVRMWFQKDVAIHPEKSLVLRLIHRVLPVREGFVGGRFFVREGWRLEATLMLVVLLFVETTDVIFALDSIPAILAITRDMFIVYTSNIFAIFGLRALYFAIAGLMRLFHHLHYGLSAILVFVGVKMLIGPWLIVPIGVALGVVAGILALAVGASLLWPKPAEEAPNEP